MEHSEASFLRRAAQRLASEPMVMASALAAHRQLTGMGDHEQAAWLGFHDRLGWPDEPLERMAQLALCLRPNPTDWHGAEAVTNLAHYIGCNPARLRQLLISVSQPLDPNTPGHP